MKGYPTQDVTNAKVKKPWCEHNDIHSISSSSLLRSSFPPWPRDISSGSQLFKEARFFLSGHPRSHPQAWTVEDEATPWTFFEQITLATTLWFWAFNKMFLLNYGYLNLRL